MGFMAEGRLSDALYVESIWRGESDLDFSLPCPADGRWNLRIAKLNGNVEVLVEGPMTRAVDKTHVEGIDWLVIKFKMGTFMRRVPIRNFLDGDVALPEAASRGSFWLGDCAWEVPDYENADTFVEHLIREEILMFDSVVDSALQDQPQEMSSRTLRHRFLQVTGLSQNTIRQIERARQAADLLEMDVPILDVVYQMGYADQPHMTRALKYYMGRTPAQVPLTKRPR